MKLIKTISFVMLLFVLMMTAAAETVFCGIRIYEIRKEEALSEEYYKRMAQMIRGEEKIPQVLSQETDKSSPEFCFGMAGWISIDGTCIDYPVMQEAESGPGYYLDHRPDGSRASCGCLYIPAGDTVDSDNIVIYGHNMRNGSMFAGLSSYKDSDWAREHKTICLLTGEGRREYEVIAVVVQTAGNRRFTWEDHSCFQDDEDRVRYGSRALEYSVTDMGNTCISLLGDAGYLTLVTCDYSVDNGRLAVIAVLCD